MEDLIARGKKIINAQQNTVLSAASLIMVMIVASRILGLIRQRVLANYFPPSDLSLFFAAFRLPDTIFEVLVFGTFSSAFIPVFSRALKDGQRRAWAIAGRVVTIGLIIFVGAAAVLSIWAPQIYSVIAPGYGTAETNKIALLARILFAAQGFFAAHGFFFGAQGFCATCERLFGRAAHGLHGAAAASGAPSMSPEDIIEATRGRRLRFMQPPLCG